MEILLLKSGACLAILMLFYKLVLENQSFHQFKRFYLLGGIIASLIIPFVSFTQYVEVAPVENLDLSTALTPYFPVDNEFQDIETPINYWPIILWSIYGLGVLVFFIRFVKNLSRLLTKIKVNEKIKKNSYTEVLLKQLEPPHTFFNYIFFNRDKAKAKAIPNEVILHEASHAKQKHSLDILFVEILQIVFWFNPLLYFIKKDIKLNHEFLADAEVLNNNIESTNYKKILLEFANPHQDYALANTINYSSIKKRFTVMKTQTSKKRLWLSTFVLLPLLGLLLYSFSSREIIEIEAPQVIEQKLDYAIEVNAKGELFYEKEKYELNEVDKFLPIVDNLRITLVLDQDFNPEKTQELTTNVMSTLRDKGVRKLSVCTSQDFENNEQNQNPPTKKEIAAYNEWANNVRSKFTKLSGDAILMPPTEEKDLVKNLRIYERMTNKQKEEAVEIPYPGLKVNTLENSISTETKFSSPTILVNGKNCDPCELTKKEILNMKLTSSNGDEVNSFAIKFKGYPTQGNQGNTLNKKTKAIVSQYNENSPAQILNIRLEGSKENFSKLILIKQQKEVTEKELKAYNDWAKRMKAEFKKRSKSETVNGYPYLINDETFRYHNSILDRMTTKQKNEAESMPEAVLVTEWPMPTYEVIETIPVKEQQNPPTKKEVAAYNTWAKNINDKTKVAESDKSKKYPIVKHKEVVKYKAIYNRMSEKQKANAQPWPNFPPPPPPPPQAPKKGSNDLPPPPPPPKASDKQLAAYNAWAEKMNKKPIAERIIKLKDFKYYESIYKIMTDEQRENAQPLPDVPPPPPPHPGYNKNKKGGPNAISYLKEANSKGAILTHLDAKPSQIPFYNTHLSLSEAIELIENDSSMNLYPYNSPHSGLIVLISNNAKNILPKLTSNNRIEYLNVISSLGSKFYVNEKEVNLKTAKRFIRKNPNAKINSSVTPPVVKIESS